MTDSAGASVSASATVDIVNTPPFFPAAAAVTPPTGVLTGTPLECAATAEDIDGDVPSVTYSWTVGGVEVATGAQYTVDPADTDPGDAVLCTATATDALGATAESPASALVENSDPAITGLALDPSAIGTYGSIACAAVLSDPDGSTPSAAYAWTNLTTGLPVGSEETLVLDATQASVGDQIECVLTLSDAHGGTATDSAGFEVQSTPPMFTSPAAIDPASGVTVESALACLAEAVDETGSVLPLSYEWTLGDGTVLGSVESSSAGASLVIEGSAAIGDIVTCTATATDSGGETSQSTASVTVGDSPPVAEILSLAGSGADPGVVHTDDILTVTVSGADVDGDGAVSVSDVLNVLSVFGQPC